MKAKTRERTGRDRATWLKVVLCGGLLSGLLLSRPLWLSTRAYPLTPLWSRLPPIPAPWDVVLFGALLGLVVLIAVLPRPRPVIIAVIVVSVVLCAEDQSRWQPWFYQYGLMLAALILYPWSQAASPATDDAVDARRQTALHTCRFLVAAVYFWSGIQKANWTFVHNIFPWMAGPVAHILPHALRGALPPFAYAVPLLEFGTGLGLLSVRARPVAVVTAIGMHLFILTCLGPWGLDWNSVVWPWNVAMILFVVLLFGRDRTPFLGPLLQESVHLKRSVVPGLALLLCGIMPLFSFWNHWDSYLSMTLYSGDTIRAEISLTAEDVSHLPPAIQPFAVIDGDSATLNLQTWSLGITNAPPYPEMRIYRNVARSVCGDLGPTADIQLVTLGKPNWRTGETQEHDDGCRDLR